MVKTIILLLANLFFSLANANLLFKTVCIKGKAVSCV